MPVYYYFWHKLFMRFEKQRVTPTFVTKPLIACFQMQKGGAFQTIAGIPSTVNFSEPTFI